MYALMVRCRALDAKSDRQSRRTNERKPARTQGRKPDARTGSAPSRTIAREAFLAATSMHLAPGDLLCPEPGDRTAERLAPAGKRPETSGLGVSAPPAVRPEALVLCAAVARGLQAAAGEGIVLAYASAGAPNPGWATALEWAQAAQLPLLLACTDASGDILSRRRAPSPAAKKGEPPLNIGSVNQLAQRLRLPVMPVDGEDAVAVYRVMQECALRARMGGGPAVIWAVMTPSSGPEGLPRVQQPIPRLKSYMAARGISLT